MIPLSFIFAVVSTAGVLLIAFANDENYRKIGLYIFLVSFLAMGLQFLVDYPAEQNIESVIIGLGIALLMLVLLLDLLKIFTFAVKWIQNRR